MKAKCRILLTTLSMPMRKRSLSWGVCAIVRLETGGPIAGGVSIAINRTANSSWACSVSPEFMLRPIEEIIDIDSDEIFQYPWLFAVAVGDWVLTDAHALRLRQYFDRGGFMMVDDFHGEREWRDFMAGVRKIYPAATASELEDGNPAFHVVLT